MQHFKHVSFLIEASELETLPEGLRDRYRYQAKKVADKNVLRMHKSNKRRYCQRCFAKYSECINLKKENDHFVQKCEKCFYSRNIPIKEREPKVRKRSLK